MSQLQYWVWLSMRFGVRPKMKLALVEHFGTPRDVYFATEADYRVRVPLRRVIVLEGVQDPGNVGTAIRTANALGMDAVVLTGACADLYGPKTVRATMGALFRQPVLTCATDELMQLLRANGLKLYGAALTDTAQDLRRVPLTPAAVAIGSEGRGLSAELLAQCDGQIIIPMQPGAESLNAAVAAAVVMWEIARTET